MKNYSEFDVLKTLNQKRSLVIDTQNKIIAQMDSDIASRRGIDVHEIGIKTRGKLDYLKRVHKYTVII